VERVERVENKRTHETKVALLAEVTDGGGRFSTRPEEVEWEEPEAPLSRLEDVPKCSDEEGWLRSRELLPGVSGRLVEKNGGDGEVNVEEWFKSSLREYFGNEGSE
jgi:hypothetical protein